MNISQKDFANIVSNAIDENGEMAWKDVQFLAVKFCDFNPDDHANGWMPIRDALLKKFTRRPINTSPVYWSWAPTGVHARQH